MKRLLSLFVVLALSPSLARAEPLACNGARALDPIGLYGTPHLKFDIVRKGQSIGAHEVRFDTQGSTLAVDVRTRIDVSILFVPVYSYDYQSREVWCADQLMSIRSTVNENGQKGETHAERPGYATNHWNIAALDKDQLFNTLTGRHNRIEIATSQDQLWFDQIGGHVPAQRFDVSGELQFTSWYDQQGRWLKLAFLDKRGTPIELICSNCRPPSLEGAVSS